MASILLSYVDSDKAAATALAKTLSRDKHTIHHADHKVPASRSREDVDCIIVVWSAAAVASPYLYEDARVALKLRKLWQVSIGLVDLSLLPLVFRAEPVIPIDDTEHLRALLRHHDLPSLEVIARSESQGDAASKQEETLFSTSPLDALLRRRPPTPPTPSEEQPAPPTTSPEDERREKQPAPSPPNLLGEGIDERRSSPRAKSQRAYARSIEAPGYQLELHGDVERSELNELAFRRETPPPIPPELCRAALENEAGQLVYQVPKKMRRGVAEVVEVRLGRDHQVMTIGFVGSGRVTIENLCQSLRQ